jgi:hypothetical protein
MVTPAQVDSLVAFCSYCGRPPQGEWAEREHRVCMRCGFGVVLRTSADVDHLRQMPFLILDDARNVQGISRIAEAALGRDEAEVIETPLEQLLVPGESADELRTVESPGMRFGTRLCECGPPKAVLVVLSRRG